MKRKSMMRTLTVTLGICGVCRRDCLRTPDSGTSVPLEEAWQKLMDGNRNYVENKLTIAATSDAAARMALAKIPETVRSHPYLFRLQGSA